MSFVGIVPDVSIPYTLVESDKLPRRAAYAWILDVAGDVAALGRPARCSGRHPHRPPTGGAGRLVGAVISPWRRGCYCRARHRDPACTMSTTCRPGASLTRRHGSTTVCATWWRRCRRWPRGEAIMCSARSWSGRRGRGAGRAAAVHPGLDALAGLALVRAGAWVGATGRWMAAVHRRPIQVGSVVLAVIVLVRGGRPASPRWCGWARSASSWSLEVAWRCLFAPPRDGRRCPALRGGRPRRSIGPDAYLWLLGGILVAVHDHHGRVRRHEIAAIRSGSSCWACWSGRGPVARQAADARAVTAVGVAALALPRWLAALARLRPWRLTTAVVGLTAAVRRRGHLRHRRRR